MGQLHADRDGEVLDLQVIAGQTVAVVQRLGTIGRVAGGGASLKAVSYFGLPEKWKIASAAVDLSC